LSEKKRISGKTVAAGIVLIALVVISAGYYLSLPKLPTQVADSDGDGVPDSQDLWPGQDDNVFGSTLYIATGENPASMYTFSSRTDSSETRVINEIYETLTTLRGAAADKVDPGLAYKWEISPDGKAYTFFLRDNVTYTTDSDGDGKLDKMTAKDWVWIFDIVANSNAWSEIGGLPAYDHVVLVDDYTFTVYLKWPVPYFLFFCTNPYTGLQAINPAWVAKNGGPTNEEFLRNHADGTGPYMLKEWVMGDRIVFEANPNYWRGWEGPHVKTIVKKIIPEAATRMMLIGAGDVDIAQVPLTNIPDMIRRVKEENLPLVIPTTDADGNPLLGLREGYLHLNTQVLPTSDLHVRRALAYSFDYDTFVNEVKRGYALKTSGFVPRGVYGYWPEAPSYVFDLDKAKQELEQASPEAKAALKQGITMYYVPGFLIEKEGAIMWQADLAKIGINLELREHDYAGWLDRVAIMPGDPILEWFWDIDYPDPADYAYYYTTKTPFLSDSTWPPNGWNSARAGNATTDALAQQGLLEQDENKRMEIYHTLFTMAYQESWWISMFQSHGASHVENAFQSYVRGYIYNPFTYAHESYYSVYKEPVKSGSAAQAASVEPYLAVLPSAAPNYANAQLARYSKQPCN
jgi:ABC-type transport system substrate-binding protein